jgi:hypothetical protein
LESANGIPEGGRRLAGLDQLAGIDPVQLDVLDGGGLGRGDLADPGAGPRPCQDRRPDPPVRRRPRKLREVRGIGSRRCDAGRRPRRNIGPSRSRSPKDPPRPVRWSRAARSSPLGPRRGNHGHWRPPVTEPDRGSQGRRGRKLSKIKVDSRVMIYCSICCRQLPGSSPVATRRRPTVAGRFPDDAPGAVHRVASFSIGDLPIHRTYFREPPRLRVGDAVELMGGDRSVVDGGPPGNSATPLSSSRPG